MYRALEKASQRVYPGSTALPGMLTRYTYFSPSLYKFVEFTWAAVSEVIAEK